MKNEILAISLVALVLSLGVVGASAAMPNNQCYKMASQKDNALKNTIETLQGSGNRINPCTGILDTASTYYEMDNGITHIRTVYGNGDASGNLALTNYVVCQDGRAKISHKIYGPMGYGMGFFSNFPFDDDPSTWMKDKETCNTL